MASDRKSAATDQTGDPAIRLALAYSRADDRPVFEDLFALDRRMADAVRQASEPIIAQLKLAWWRDRFAQDRNDWPKGEPLLARLSQWDADVSRLGALVDGWEALLADGPLTQDAIMVFGEGRASAWDTAAAILGETGEGMHHAALLWSFADLAQHCSGEEDGDRVRALARSLELGKVRAGSSRRLRPFAILGALGRRSLQTGRPMLSSPGDFLAVLRTGMLGR